MTLGEKIKALRKEKGYSIEHCAEELGVHRSAWMYWEKGRYTPYLSSACDIAEFFEISVDKLIRDEKGNRMI